MYSQKLFQFLLLLMLIFHYSSCTSSPLKRKTTSSLVRQACTNCSMFSSPSSPTSIFWNICLAIVSTSSWHDNQYYMEDLLCATFTFGAPSMSWSVPKISSISSSPTVPLMKFIYYLWIFKSYIFTYLNCLCHTSQISTSVSLLESLRLACQWRSRIPW